MFRGTSQTVTVTSDPSGADVIDQPSGTRFTTPATVKMSRGEYHTLHVSRNGYEAQQFPMRREASVGYWIADAFMLGIGTLIDVTTGAMFHIKPKRVHVVLEPAEGRSAEP
jgi:hypothetical protein